MIKMPSNKAIIAFIVIIKGLLFAFFLLNDHPHYMPGFWGYSVNSDEITYLDPIDNLLKNGEYLPDFRMPGYGVFYMAFRLFFERATSCNIMIFVQLLLDMLSTYLLFRIADKLFRSKLVSLLTLVIYTLSFSVTIFDYSVLTESFCVSLMIISIYLFLDYIDTKKSLTLFLSGLFMAWTIFIRPAAGLIWFSMLAYLGVLFLQKRGILSFRQLVIAGLLFGSTFVVFDTAWIVRNHQKYGMFIPLMRTPQADMAHATSENYYPFLYTFVTSWGGDQVYWDPTAEIRWFGLKEHSIETAQNASLNTQTKKLPAYIYTSRYNEDSLIMLRDMITSYDAEMNTLGQEEKDKRAYAINSRLLEYKASVIKEKPLLYYVKGPLLITKKFLLNNGTNGLFVKPFSQLSLFQKLFKILSSLLYLSVVLGGFAGLVVLLINRQVLTPAFLLFVIILGNTFVITYLFRTSEVRYIIITYPFLTISLAYLLCSVLGLKVFSRFFQLSN